MEETLDLIYKDPKYPSSKVVNGLSMAGPRAHLRGMGLDNEDLSKPFIGVINTYNEMHPGHVHLDRLGKLVRDGVLEAGGIPFEVNTISICDGFSQGHVGMCSVLPSREIIADSIEPGTGRHQHCRARLPLFTGKGPLLRQGAAPVRGPNHRKAGMQLSHPAFQIILIQGGSFHGRDTGSHL